MAALATVFDGICLCGSTDVPEELAPEADEYMMVSMTYNVLDDFDGWMAAFEQLEKTGFHRDLGCVKSYVGKYEESAGRVFKKIEAYVHVVHVFRKERYDDARDAFSGRRAPYVDALEQVFSNVVSELDDLAGGDAEVLVSLHHGVDEFSQWFEDYAAKEKAGAYKALAPAKAVVGEVMPGCAGAHLVYLLPKSAEAHLQIDFDAEPYVGGEDLIKNRKVFRPYGSSKSALVFRKD